MLLTLLIVNLFALVVSNPFHKYPYVFLLDVGNEELQKTNSEQIRVSIPGGSLALRYPAIGDGDTIVHVRVSGIDFGTDLKVNIVDGGPGSKYVVLVFMGNPGVAYDAVLTIQTISEVDAGNDSQDIESNDIDDNTKEVSEEDANNSAEEIDDSENETNKYNSKSELAQESNHNYNYANNVRQDSDDYPNDEIKDENAQISKQDVDVTDYDENKDSVNIGSAAEGNDDALQGNNVYSYVANDYYNKEEAAGIVDNLYYDRLNFIRPYLYNGGRIYSDQAIQFDPEDKTKTSYQRDMEADQGSANDDVNEVSKDDNNNYYDTDDNPAVES